jgi:hypothetical protein
LRPYSKKAIASSQLDEDISVSVLQVLA